MQQRINPLMFVSVVAIFAGVLFMGVRGAVAVGPAFIDSFVVTCGDRGDGGAATKIASGEGQISYECRVDDDAGVSVFVGDSTVIAETEDAIDGGVIGTKFIASDRFGGNAREEYCATTAGTANIYCRALVTKSGL